MEASCKNSISLHLFPPSNFRLQPLSILFCLLSNSCHLPPSSGLAPSTIPLLAHSAFLLYFLLSSPYKPVQISIVLKIIYIQLLLLLAFSASFQSNRSSFLHENCPKIIRCLFLENPEESLLSLLLFLSSIWPSWTCSLSWKSFHHSLHDTITLLISSISGYSSQSLCRFFSPSAYYLNLVVP